MRKITTLSLLAIVFLLSNCSKSEDADPITPVNCDGLVTDTTGSNENAKIYMSTAFTPNGDGLNDVIRPIAAANIASLAFTIYDENNVVVFSTTQLMQGWSPATGTNISTKYYYKIQATTTANRQLGMCGTLYRLTCIPATLPISSLDFEDELTINGYTGVTAESLSTCP